MNNIKRFQDDKVLEIPLENNYSEDHIMHTFLDSFNQGSRY